MKLYFMKQSALDYMKANMKNLYNNYYKYDSPDWISALFDYDPFVLFKEVPDFELANLEMQPGEIVMQNCKILFSKLRDITDSQASNERLWAGLCNKTFYSYIRGRWKYAKRHLRESSDDSSAIINRYFYKNSGRSGMFRNTLARCWWTGRLTYSEKSSNQWELLDAIGQEDIVSKISDIFYSYTYTSNSNIVEGFCQGLKFYRDHGIYISTRKHIRRTAQHLNTLGGSQLLDMFTADEIKKIVVDHIDKVRKGEDTSIVEDEVDNNDSLIDTDDELDKDAEEVNVDYEDYLDSLEPVAHLDLDKLLGELILVEYGCIVTIYNKTTDNLYILPMPLAGEEMNTLQKQIFNKPVGFSCVINKKTYEVNEIHRFK